MELDFETVKALSSRIRINILTEVIQNESTPTDISNAVNRSKSTVSSHLRKLQKADLLEKEKVEGRRRVIYRPTDKTKTILKGKRRKVKFSIISSVSNAWIGLGLGLGALSLKTGRTQASRDMSAMALDKGVETYQSTAQTSFLSSNPELVVLVGGCFVFASILGAVYGFSMSRISE